MGLQGCNTRALLRFKLAELPRTIQQFGFFVKAWLSSNKEIMVDKIDLSSSFIIRC